MKKKYIKDVKDRETLEQLFYKNTKLQDIVYQDYANMLGEEEGEFISAYLGKDYHKYLEFRDHYNSFYFILRDPEAFIQNIDIQCATTQEEELYRKIETLYKKMQEEELYTDTYYDIYNELEEKAKELLDIIVDNIKKEYEDIKEEDVLNYFIDSVQEWMYLGELYFYPDMQNYILFEDVIQCYE